MRIVRKIREELQQYIDARIEIDENGCHNWIPNISRDGYGRVVFNYMSPYLQQYMFNRFGNKFSMQSHKVSYLINGGSLTKDRPLVLHHCDNPRCCNHRHLFGGNNSTNANCLGAQINRRTPSILYSQDVLDKVDNMILDGYSFRSISRKYGMCITHLSQHIAPTLEALGWILPQRVR